MNVVDADKAKMIYSMLVSFDKSRLCAADFAKKIGVSTRTIYEWRYYFVPDSPRAKHDWINITGPLERLTPVRKVNVICAYDNWLKLCKELDSADKDC